MNSNEIIELRKTKRRENRSKVRQALFISEYVFQKHFAVYEEAANFYNELNTIYPVKHDLRKTDEFKAMKLGIPYQMKTKKVTRKLVKHHHQPIPVTLGNSFTLICEEAANPEQHTEGDEPVSPEQHTEVDKPVSPEQHTEVDEPVSPEQHTEVDEPVSPEQHTEVDEPVSPEQHTEVDEPVSPEQHAEVDEPVSPEKPASSQQGKQKVMQLRIPLLKPSVITQTVQIVTDEVLEENPLQVAAEEVVQQSAPLYPSLDEEIPNEILERIINELREDPELRKIMTNIEQDIEFEQIGMDLDIPEDRLEQELNCEFW